MSETKNPYLILFTFGALIGKNRLACPEHPLKVRDLESTCGHLTATSGLRTWDVVSRAKDRTEAH